MGFYHPATLVKDAQRHGVRFAPIDVQVSDWECRVEPDGRIRLGLMYVNGLREATGRAIAAGVPQPPARRVRTGSCRAASRMVRRRSNARSAGATTSRCWKRRRSRRCFCNICAHEWGGPVAAVSTGDPAPRQAAGRSGPFATGRSRRSSRQPACAATSWRRWPKSAPSMPSATIAAARCGRSSGPCGRRVSCSRKTRAGGSGGRILPAVDAGATPSGEPRRACRRDADPELRLPVRSGR